MKVIHAALLLLAALSQAACVPTPEQAARLSPREVRVTDDPFRPTIAFAVLPPITFALPQDRSTFVDVVLTGGITRATREATFLATIKVEYLAASWAFFEEIRGEGGRPLTFVGARRNVRCLTGGCIYTEEFAAGLSASDVRRSAENGTPIVFKVFSRNGSEFPVTIPAAFSRMLLARMEPAGIAASVREPEPAARTAAQPMAPGTVVAARTPAGQATSPNPRVSPPGEAPAPRNPYDLVAVANDARGACVRARRANCDAEVEAALRRAEDERQRQAPGRALGK